MLHQSGRSKRGAISPVFELFVIGRFSPVWITANLAVNEADTRRLAARLPDLVVDATADGIVVPGGEVGVVGVKALHAA
jgi:hypothetical protein